MLSTDIFRIYEEFHEINPPPQHDALQKILITISSVPMNLSNMVLGLMGIIAQTEGTISGNVGEGWHLPVQLRQADKCRGRAAYTYTTVFAL